MWEEWRGRSSQLEVVVVVAAAAATDATTGGWLVLASEVAYTHD